MLFYKLFRQPYLDAPTDGMGAGGGEPTPEPNPEPTTTPEPEPTPAPKGNEPAPEPQPKIKVKYNHQEMELPYDEAVNHIQKGMNYDKAVERAKQEARDEYIASKGYEWKGKPIKTESELNEALKEQELENKYKNQGLPEDVVNELVENRKFREKYESEQKSKEQKEREKADLKEFVDAFPDVKADDIPTEVWQANAKGIPLRYAYAEHALKLTREAEAKAKANAENAKDSMGSVGSNGNATDSIITEETINSHANDTKWMMKNYKHVEAFYARKKG